MITHDIRTAEANLSLATADFAYLQMACQGFPGLIKKLSRELQVLVDERRRFERATKREQAQWKSAGEKQEPVRALGSSNLMQLATSNTASPRPN